MDPFNLSSVDFIYVLLDPFHQKDVFMAAVVCHLDAAASKNVLLSIRLIVIL